MGDPTTELKNLRFSEDDILNMSKHIFYCKSPDTTVILKDGKSISFNKSMLCATARSPILYQIFFGPLKDEEITHITDVDYDTFYLFLDCIMGYEEITYESAFQIFPVVWKYQIDDAIEKCIKALKPCVMNEKVCHILNMAVFCACKKLVTEVFNFISKCSLLKVLEDEKYCHLLEVDSMKFVLSKLKIDSFIMGKVLKWGGNYVEKNEQVGKSVYELFKDSGLLQYFQLGYFETTGALYNFRRSETGQKIFPAEEVLSYLESADNLTHRISTWMKMNENLSITETIDIPVTIVYFCDFIANIEIEGNKVVYYESNDSRTINVIYCAIDFILQDDLGNVVFKQQGDHEVIDLKSKLRCHFCYKFKDHKEYDDMLLPFKLTVKLHWYFPTECRVLLTNKPNDELNRFMYFAKNVSFYI